jgi:hypothetical protein
MVPPGMAPPAPGAGDARRCPISTLLPAPPSGMKARLAGLGPNLALLGIYRPLARRGPRALTRSRSPAWGRCRP